MTARAPIREGTRRFSRSRLAILFVVLLVIAGYYSSQYVSPAARPIATRPATTSSSLTVTTVSVTVTATVSVTVTISSTNASTPSTTVTPTSSSNTSTVSPTVTTTSSSNTSIISPTVTTTSSSNTSTTFQSAAEIYSIPPEVLLSWLNKSGIEIVRSSTSIPYYIVEENESHIVTGLLYLTTDIAPDSSYGYNAPISTLVLVNTTGYIKQLTIWQISDSWGYRITQDWLNTLVNRSVFETMEVGVDVQGVTGATYSSKGVVNGVRDAGRIVVNDYQKSLDPSANTTSSAIALFLAGIASGFTEMGLKSEVSLISLIVLFAGAVAAFELRNARLKDAVLVGSIVFIGFYATEMVSIGDFTTFLKLTFPPISRSIFWYWYVLYGAVLATSLVWGRLYCGYLCPFGSFTEILHRISPLKLKVPSSIHYKLRYARFVVFGVVVLGVLGGVLFLQFEPFGTFFLLIGDTLAWAFLLSFLALSIFLNRPYCSYVCPAGAGLSLLAWFRVREIKRWPECKKCMICANECPTQAIRADRISVLDCMGCRTCETNYSNVGICPHYASERVSMAKAGQSIDDGARTPQA